jgi:hypothetical protein
MALIYAAVDLQVGMRARPAAAGYENDVITITSVEQPKKYRGTRLDTVVYGSGREFHVEAESEWIVTPV